MYKYLNEFLAKSKYLVGMTEIGMTSKLRGELFDMMSVYSNLKVSDLNFADDEMKIRKKDIANMLNSIEYTGKEFAESERPDINNYDKDTIW